MYHIVSGLSQFSRLATITYNEKVLLKDMGETFYKIVIQLQEFEFVYSDFRSVQDAKDHELLMTNRLIKKEVIDIADLQEQVSKVLVIINDKMVEDNTFMLDQMNNMSGRMNILD